MRTQSRDTSEDIERLLIHGHQQFSPSMRFARVRSMTYTLAEANRHQSGTKNSLDRDLAFLRHVYGHPYALAFQNHGPVLPSPAFDVLPSLELLARLFAERQVPFALTGSLACCLYGFPRTCRDIDLLVRPQDLVRLDPVSLGFVMVEEDRAPVVGFPEVAHWLDPHTLIKVDLVAAPFPLSSAWLLHRAAAIPVTEDGFTLPVLTAEDVVLTRLQWYRATGSQADDQWNDLMGLVKVQAPTLDATYLLAQSQRLQVAGELAQLFVDTEFEGMAHESTDEHAGCPAHPAADY